MASNGGDLELISPMKKKDCFFFVQYGMCSFGDACRFNHPTPQDSPVVQEAGKTNSLYENYNTQNIPCKFYLAGFCKYGIYCDFSHTIPDVTLTYNSDGLPMRLDEPVCNFYAHNLWCGFGACCKFHHPEIIHSISHFYLAGFCKYGIYCDFSHTIPDVTLTYNSDGLPVRLDEPVCNFYARNLWCGFGACCRFHHPEIIYSTPQKCDSDQAQEHVDVDDGLLGSTDE